MLLAALLVPSLATAQTVTLELASTVLTEGADTAAFVRRSGGGGSTRVRLRTQDGSASLPAFAAATGGVDYGATDVELVLGGRDVEFVIIETFDDGRPEPNEVFDVVLEVLSGGTVAGPDRFTVEILDDSEPAEEGLELVVDRATEIGAPLLAYEIEVTNRGQLPVPVTLAAVVPVSTGFWAGRSSRGWSCDPGPYEGSVCEIPLGSLAGGEIRSVDFAFRLRSGTPAGYEPLVEVGFAGPAEQADSALRVTEPSHGSCSRTYTRDFGEGCRLHWVDLNLNGGHPARCSLAFFQVVGPGCCFDRVGGGRCDTTCLAKCDVPCNEVSLPRTARP